MKIELASHSDIPQLDQLVHTCFRSPESFQGWTTEANMLGGCRTTPERLRREMSNPNYKILKCIDEDDQSGKIISCISALQHGERMQLGMLCVLPNHQGQGLGKKMINAVEDHGRKLNCVKLFAEVIPTRKEIVSWYQRQGFYLNGKGYPFPEPTIEYGIPKEPIELVEVERLIK